MEIRKKKFRDILDRFLIMQDISNNSDIQTLVLMPDFPENQINFYGVI